MARRMLSVDVWFQGNYGAEKHSVEVPSEMFRDRDGALTLDIERVQRALELGTAEVARREREDRMAAAMERLADALDKGGAARRGGA